MRRSVLPKLIACPAAPLRTCGTRLHGMVTGGLTLIWPVNVRFGGARATGRVKRLLLPLSYMRPSMRQPTFTYPSVHRLFRRVTFTRSVLAGAAHLALVSVAVGGLAAAPMPANAQAASRSYEIPAGSLDEALTRFGSAAGILLSFPADLTKGRASPGLRGSFTVDTGLAALLANTGLQAVRQGDGSYQLRSVAAAPATAASTSVARPSVS